MNYGIELFETEEKIKDKNDNLDNINGEIKNLEEDLKHSFTELKALKILEIKNLGKQKNSIKKEINELLYQINNPEGLRAKIARLGADSTFKIKVPNTSGFVDWVYKIAINIPELQNRFNEIMLRNIVNEHC